MHPQSDTAVALSAADDGALAARVAQDDHVAFELLMRRHNSRLFRVARAILRDDADAEDALQDAYLDAYRHIGEFRGDAEVSTWLTRIVINQGRMRLRKRKRDGIVVRLGGRPAAERDLERDPAEADVVDERTESPTGAVLRGELRRLLERRIDDLPVVFRTVFVMRDVDDMSVQETAECLCIPSATVRTRLFRARTLLREALARDLDAATLDVFGFGRERCDRIVAGVLPRVSRADAPPGFAGTLGPETASNGGARQPAAAEEGT
jgi:RNA polymerase sigma-70 factor (ECF subfamily)